MIRTIWKFPVSPMDGFALALPRGAQVLTVQTQHGMPQLWALVNPDEPREERLFRLVGTGHMLKGDDWRYVNSFQLHEGQLVFHLFEWEGSA